jgi:hypothetical protein
MSELKQYQVTTDTGYTTTFQFSDEDAKERGLLGKDVESVAAAKVKEEADAAAAAKALADAEAEAKAKADAEAAAAAKVDAEKQAAAPQNKQAKPAGSK